MSNELPRGLIVKDKHPNAPDFIVCKVSVKIDEFIQTLQSNNNNGWCNLEFCRSRDGKLYPKFDTFKPEQGQRQAPQQPAPQADPLRIA